MRSLSYIPKEEKATWEAIRPVPNTASGSQFFKQMIQKDSFVEKQIKRKTSFQTPHNTRVKIKQISRYGQN